MDPVQRRTLRSLAGTLGEGNYFELILTIDDDLIVEAQFSCHPCTIAHSIGRRLVQMTVGQTLKSVLSSLPEWLQDERARVPYSRLGALGLAVEAVAKAVSAGDEHECRT